jgi:hypothetical protein
VRLDDQSRTAAGQIIAFPHRSVTTLELIIRGDDSGRVSEPGRPVRYNGLSEVGFSEVDVNGLHGDELVRLPSDLLAAAGDTSSNHPLTLVLERQRTDPAEAVRNDEELAIARSWTQPSARTFTLAGEARLSSRVNDDAADLLLGVIGPTATSSQRLAGDLRARASSAIDGDPSTAWTSAFDSAGNDTLSFQTGRPITFSHLDMRVVADGIHSVPTHLRIEIDGRPAANVTVPAVTDQPGAHGAAAAVKVPIDLAEPVTGSNINIVVDGVREITTTDWFSNASVRMPVSIAELGIGGLTAAAPTGEFDSGCRTDLLSVDDQPIGISFTGSLADASAGRPLTIAPCGADNIHLDAGSHVLRAAKGIDTGLDLDRLVLQSSAGGDAPTGVLPLGDGRGSAPTVQVDRQGRTDVDLTITNATPGTAFWVVLGQSHNDGWTATVDGHDLGKPQLVDGYANGWLLSPSAATVRVQLNWAPQRLVWICLVLSALSVALCLVLAVRRPRGDASDPVDDPLPEPIQWRTFVRSVGRDEPRVLTSLGVAAGAGILTAVVIGPVAGLVTAFVALVASRRRRARWWLALGSPGLLAISGLYVVGRQAVSQPTPAFEWPGEQGAVHQVAWMAVAFLIVLVVVDAVWERVNRRGLEVADAAASAPPDDASPTSDAPDFPL